MYRESSREVTLYEYQEPKQAIFAGCDLRGRPIRRSKGEKLMIVVTTDFIPGYSIKEALGIAIGNTVRAKHIGKDILAGLRTIAGGEINEYSEMLSDARQVAIARMIQYAERLDADAVINVRFSTSSTVQGAAELLAYGTAVKAVKGRE